MSYALLSDPTRRAQAFLVHLQVESRMLRFLKKRLSIRGASISSLLYTWGADDSVVLAIRESVPEVPASDLRREFKVIRVYVGLLGLIDLVAKEQRLRDHLVQEYLLANGVVAGFVDAGEFLANEALAIRVLELRQVINAQLLTPA